MRKFIPLSHGYVDAARFPLLQRYLRRLARQGKQVLVGVSGSNMLPEDYHSTVVHV